MDDELLEKMKILLIKSERLMETERWVVNPLGIMSLGSVAREAGHDVRLLDLRIERGKEVRRVLDRALDAKPDLVGLSALSHQARITMRVSEYVKRHLPDAFQLAGGPLANTDPEYLMRRAHVDACVLGEGEQTFTDVLAVLANHGDMAEVAGLALLENGGLTHTPSRELIQDLDRIPLPTWDMIDLDRYAKFIAMSMRLYKRASMQTSRGCPYRCTFCHNLFGKRFRGRSPEHVLDELSMLRCDHGIRYFELIDDIFNANNERAVQILEGIRDRLPDCRISFPNGIRADRMDRDFVRLMKQARCIGVYIAVETASPRLQRETNKNIDIDQVRKVASWLREERIHTGCLFMVGFPGETAEEIEQTFALASELPLDFPLISVVIPYKSTELWDRFIPDGEKAQASPDMLDPHYGYEDRNFSAITNVELRERCFSKARRPLFLNPRNWFILFAEIRYRGFNLVAWLYKLAALVAPIRYRRALAAKSNLNVSFLEADDTGS